MGLSLNHLASSCICTCPFTFEHVLQKLERMVIDTDCTSQLIGSLIISDPMLATLVLSRANGGSQESVNVLSHAISVLGLASIHGFCEECLIIGKKRQAGMATLWSAANAAASFCRIIAERASNLDEEFENPEVCRTIGLIHDIGSIIAYASFDDGIRNAEAYSDNTQYSTQIGCKQELGLRTSDFGALLARSWHLPPLYSDAIRYHRRPQDCTRFSEAAALAHLAHHFTRMIGYKPSFEHYVEDIELDALEIVGLRERQVKECLIAFLREEPEIALYEGFFAT